MLASHRFHGNEVTLSFYYESHVTVEPIFDEQKLAVFQDICRAYKFRIAELLMQKRAEDKPERSKYDTFCSSRNCDGFDLQRNMLELVKSCQALGIKVWRYKIEDVILDSKIDDTLLPLK